MNKILNGKWLQKPICVFSLVATANIFYFYRKTFKSYLLSLFKNKAKIENILTKGEKYIEKRKESFLQYIDNIDKSNENVNKEFYNKELYKESIEKDGNALENEWKRRIMVENTPRGNVYMHYDPYKLAFSYYADANISYHILNAVAMKYCSVYSCAHFFIDQDIVPIEKQSPLIKIHHIEKPKKKKEVNFTGGTNDDQDLPFAKLKNYNKTKVKDDKKGGENKKDDKIINVITNKFVYLGKSYKINWLSKTITKKKEPNFKSSLLDNLSAESQLQEQVLSYKDFKKKQN
jgi:hypothetical protein